MRSSTLGIVLMVSLGFGFLLVMVVGAVLCHLLRRQIVLYSLDSSKSQRFSRLNSVSGRSKSMRNIQQVMVVEEEEDDDDVEMGSRKLEGEELEEMMSMHNPIFVPPPFLFTIKEETAEDMDSARSSPDFYYIHGFGVDGTPPPATPDFSKGSSYRPLESLTEAEMNMLRTSPAPKLKFLKEAEDKFILQQMQEAEREGGIVKECLVGDCASSSGTKEMKWC